MATLKVSDLGDYIREQRRSAQISLRQLARLAGVSNPYLSQIERGLRKPSAEILQQIAKALRISAEALYVQAGILEDRSADTNVPAAILADVTINERQKQVLLEIYESFRTENAGRGEAARTATPAAPPAAEPEVAPTPQSVPEPAPEPQPEPEPQAQAEPEPEPEPQAQPEPEPEPAPQAPQQASQPPPPAEPEPSGDGAGAYITPLVRKLASEHGVDLAGVRGTGVGGRIRKQDVLDAARGARSAGAAPQRDTAATEGSERIPTPAARTQAPAGASADQATRASVDTSVRGRTEKLSRLRQVIAHRMVESLQVSAQLTTVVEADITKIARIRERAKAEFEAREGVKLSYLPFFALATCEALREHPAVNSSIDLEANTVTYHDAVHLGIAVDTPRGLLVPVIKDASDLNLAGLARKIADLAERTRSNQVGPDELGGGTFTLTNTGSRGALFDTPIINQPQVGVLGTGAVVKRPVVVDDPDVGEVIAVRHMVFLALTYDHRMVDGADAARFLNEVRARLEEGDFESEVGL